MFDPPVAVEHRRLLRMEDALKKIAAWDKSTFPPVVDRQNGGTMSYGTAYGSNGERDFMRRLAEEALKP